MSVAIEEKFRSTGLDINDEPELKSQIIRYRKDSSKLISYIYMYGYSFKEDEYILEVCHEYIINMVPSLTAECMKVAIDYWGHLDRYLPTLEYFLDIDLFDEWYDEFIFTLNFINNRKDIQLPQDILDKFNSTINDPRFDDLDIF